MDWFANSGSAVFWSIALIALMLLVGVIASIRRYFVAQEEMRISREFFQSTFDAAAVGMAIADTQGRYIKVNKAMCEFVGYSEAELLTMSYHDITHPEDLAANDQGRLGLLNGEYPTFQMEKRYVCKDGRAVWALMVVSGVLDKNGCVAYSVGQMLDIDTRKQVEQHLRSSKETLAQAQRIARMAEWEWRIADDVFLCSDQVPGMFQISPEQIPRNRDEFLAAIHQGCRLIVQFAVSEALQRGKSFAIDVQLSPTIAPKTYISLRGEVLFDADGCPQRLYGTLQDITERELNKQVLSESRRMLRELSSHQEILLERERKRISREIHDELGQRLTALKMDISLMRMRFGNDAGLLEKLEEMRTLAEGTIQVVRDIASDLRPAPLDLGLVPAVEWLARDVERRSDICCRLDIGSEEIAMSDDLATVVFRVVQESLTNVARHARATEVDISLRLNDGLLWLEVRDDGCGFDANAAGDGRSFGILGMRERVIGLGGRLQIDSEYGRGSVISLEIPLLNTRSP